MSLYTRYTMIVAADHAPLARALAAHLAGPPGSGMWLIGLRPIGSTGPATHYVSSGSVAAEFAPLLSDPDALWGAVQMAQQGGMALPASAPAVTYEQCVALVETSEVVNMEAPVGEVEEDDHSGESPSATFARLELELAMEEE